MTPQVLLAVLTVLNSAAIFSFSMSISGGDLRQVQAALRTFSSFSVKTDLSVLVGDGSLVGEEDMVGDGWNWSWVGSVSWRLCCGLQKQRRERNQDKRTLGDWLLCYCKGITLGEGVLDGWQVFKGRAVALAKVKVARGSERSGAASGANAVLASERHVPASDHVKFAVEV